MDTAIVLISSAIFSALILTALTAVTLIPLIMIGLLIRDKRNNDIW